MWLNRIVLAVGLLISSVAAFYSVTGLTHIFTGATIAVLIMGLVLEAGKVSAAAWLHKYWSHSNKFLRGYLIGAVVLLMAITSMGTFGFLSKAHLESTAGTAVASAQVQMYDEELQTINQDLARIDRTVGSLDNLVTTAGERGTRVRAGQRQERVLLSNERTELLTRRTELNGKRSTERRAVVGAEAELGPIKYVAEMIYGDNADEAAFDKAVRWMIIILVIVFDPLAISLLIAAQAGMHIESQRPRKQEEVLDGQPGLYPSQDSDESELEIEIESPDIADIETTLDTEKVVENQDVREPEIEEKVDPVDWLENVKNARRTQTIPDAHFVTYGSE